MFVTPQNVLYKGYISDRQSLYWMMSYLSSYLPWEKLLAEISEYKKKIIIIWTTIKWRTKTDMIDTDRHSCWFSPDTTEAAIFHQSYWLTKGIHKKIHLTNEVMSLAISLALYRLYNYLRELSEDIASWLIY